MHTKALIHACVPLHVCLLAKICFQSPFLPRLKLQVRGQQESFQLSPEDNHHWAQASEGADGVPVFQQGSFESVGVQAPMGPRFPVTRHLADLTVTSALLFALG